MILPKIKLNYDHEKLKKICVKNQIALLVVHGSQVAGQATAESDIDVGLLMKKSNQKKYFKVIGELADVFGEKCDPVFLNEAESMIAYQVALNGVPLYEAKRGLFDAFMTTSISRYQDARKFRQLEKEYLQEKVKKWNTG